MAVFSLILILGIIRPCSSSTAASLYTPPNTGELMEVIRRSPTPKELICAFCSSRSRIRYSSRELETTILQSGSPASSNITRAFLVRYARSPLSRRMPHSFTPMGSSVSLNALIALGTPLFKVL